LQAPRSWSTPRAASSASALFAAAIVLARSPGTVSLIGSVVLALGGLVALRGCPVCWAVGLFETMRRECSRLDP
jgi:hypothetical protein